jgi:hypothetical protein
MAQKKQPPSELDLINSAWESLKNNALNEYEVLKSQGWKTAKDVFPDMPKRTRLEKLDRLVLTGVLEKTKRSIVTAEGHRENIVNLYRPIISNLT